MSTLRLSTELLSQIQAHGEAHYPNEGAGLLLGETDGELRRVTQLMPLDNEFDESERYHRYQISPQDMLLAQQFADSQDLDIVGVFHSHPDHPAQPSEFDRQWALPWFSYLITRVQKGRAEESRSWLLSDDRGQFEEQALELRDHSSQEIK